jgi:hypothetical protein
MQGGLRFTGVLARGHPPDWRQVEPRKITVQEARRASRSDDAVGAAFYGDLARLKTGAPGGWPRLGVGAAGGHGDGQMVRAAPR